MLCEIRLARSMFFCRTSRSSRVWVAKILIRRQHQLDSRRHHGQRVVQFVRDSGRHRGQRIDRFVAPRLALHRAALRDVGDERDHQLAAMHMHDVETDLDGKFAAVFSAPRDFHPAPHHARLGRREKTAPMSLVPIAEALRYQDFDRLPDQFHLMVAEQLLAARIELANHPVAVGRNDSLD